MTGKNVMSPINWNIEKNNALNSKDLNLPFYLAFPDDIYLLTINNTNRNTLWEICPNLTRKTPDQMCKGSFYKCAHFLLFWIFSDLLIYHFHCYSLLFLSLYLRLHLDPCIVTLISNILRISTQILHIPTLIPHSTQPHSHPIPGFLSLLSAFHSCHCPILHFGFYREATQFAISQNLFEKSGWFS